MKNDCRNCAHELPAKAKYCPHCGQRDSDEKISLKSLLKKLWSTTFHLEGKFLRTAWQLFVPGLMTKEFFQGKQSRYPHPFRTLGIVMFFFLLMLNYRLHSTDSENSAVKFSVKEHAADTSKEMNSKDYYEKLEQRSTLESFRKNYEFLPSGLRNSQTREAMDSMTLLYARQHGQPDFSLDDTYHDTLRIALLKRNIVIAAQDIVLYEPEELIKRMGATTPLERIFIRQSIKSFKDTKALFHAYLGSLTWSLLAVSTFMAGILTLLYRRQRRYFVEHFIFLLHFHTGVLLLFTFGLVLDQLGIFSPQLYVLLALLCAVGMFFALRRYYGQGVGKTLLKWMAFILLYMAAWSISFLVGLLVVFVSY
ncbi:MAG: DUF3667 domain-containing protein [Saprospiraceae bacterium]